MFDYNQFKRSVKDWIRSHPEGTVGELRDYCEDLIPATEYARCGWLVEQTLSWYQHVISQRECRFSYGDDLPN